MISTHVCYVAFGDILGDYSTAVVIGAFMVLLGWRVHDSTSSAFMSLVSSTARYNSSTHTYSLKYD